MKSLWLLALISSVALSEVPIAYFGSSIKVSGTGCSSRDLSYLPSPDGTSISILLNKMSLESKVSSTGSIQKKCVIDIPLTVKPKYSIKIKSTDYRGFVELGKYSSASLQVQGYLSGPNTNGLGLYQILKRGLLSENLLVATGFIGSLKTGCNKQTSNYTFRLQTVLTLSTLLKGTHDLAGIDSIDLNINPGSSQVEYSSCR